MLRQTICPNKKGLFLLSDFMSIRYKSILSSCSLYKIIVNTGKAVSIYIDNSPYLISQGEILFCKPLNDVEVLDAHGKLRIIAFNRSFCNLSNLKNENEFYSFWYFGITHPYLLRINEAEKNKIEEMLAIMEYEVNRCNLPIEINRNIIREIISFSVVNINEHQDMPELNEFQLNFAKKFSTLIDVHFQKKHLQLPIGGGAKKKYTYPFVVPREVFQGKINKYSN